MEQYSGHSLKLKLEKLLSDKKPLSEFVDIQLIDIIGIDRLQYIQDDFSVNNGVASIILDLEGKTVTKPSNTNALCTLSFNTDEQCICVDKLLNRDHTCLKQCRLLEANAPITINGKHVANWKILICGFGSVISPFMKSTCDNDNDFYAMLDKMSDKIKTNFDTICENLNRKTKEISEIGHESMRLAHEFQELTVEKERLQALSDNLDGTLYQFVLNTETNTMHITYCSAKWELITGISIENANADIKNLFSKIHPDDAPVMQQAIDNSAKNLTTLFCQYRLVHDDFSVTWAEATAHPYIENKLIIWDGLILDITERKNAELKLEEYRTDLERIVKERTEQYEAINEELYATNEELYATNEELHNKNDQLQQEVAARMKVMQELELSEVKMRSFIEQSFEGIIIIDDEGIIIEWNKAQETISNVPREKVIGEYCWDVFKNFIPDGDENKSLYDDYRNLILSIIKGDNRESTEAEHALKIPGIDEIKYLTIAYFPIKLEDKCYVGEIIHDSTERKFADLELERYRTQLEEMVAVQTKELFESKERLTSLSDNLPGGVIFQLSDRNSMVPQFTYISAYFETMFDTNIEGVIEDSSLFFRLLHPEDGEKLIDLICSPQQSKSVDIECRISVNDEDMKWIHLRWSYHMFEDGTHVWDGFMIDVTTSKKAALELDETRRRQNILIKVLQIIQSSENINEAIYHALMQTGLYSGASRSYIFEKRPDGKFIDNTYEWCNEGIVPEKDNLQGMSVELLATWFNIFNRNEYICTSNIATLAPEVYEILEPQGIKSILVLPLTMSGIHFGFVGFDECSYHKEWKPAEIELLISMSQILSSAIQRNNAERSIKLSQQTMRTVLDNINAAIYVADFDTDEILFANKKVKDDMQCEVEGKACWKILHGQSEPCDFCPRPYLLDDYNKPTGLYQWEFQHKKLGRWFECSDAAIEWVNGKIVHMEYATDITDRRIAEEAVKRSEELYRQLTVASPDAIIVCDTRTIFTYVSPKAKELLLIPPDDDLENVSFERFVHPHDKQNAMKLYGTLFYGNKSVQPQLLLMRNDGSEFFGEISSAAVKDDDGQITSIIMVVRDITERRLSEMELIRAKEKAEMSDKLKSSFLANMSHEIRTPINGINGFINFIADENISAKRRNEYASIVRNSCSQLIRIIDDIIDVAKIEAQQLNIRPMTFRLDDFMNELHTFYDNYVHNNKKDKLAIILDDSQFIEPCVILSDPTRLRQVLSNLIGNATKFTDKGYIGFGYRPMPPDKLEFWVEDTGIGLPADQLDVIFERFRQVEMSNNRKYGGTGLGLTISRSLVQMMGGNLNVESVEGEGSTFRFTISYLPIEPVFEPVFAEIRQEKPEEEQYFPGSSILLVEPEVMKAKYFEKILTYNGASITEVSTINQWIDAVRQLGHIDLVLVDAKVFQNEDEEMIVKVRSVRSGLPLILIVPERNDYYNHLIKLLQCNRTIEGTPDYDSLSEELMRCI